MICGGLAFVSHVAGLEKAGVAAVEFDYYGATPPDNVRRWRERWVQQVGVPDLVRLRVRLRVRPRPVLGARKTGAKAEATSPA